MLRWIKGVTLRNKERERNENVEVDQWCNTKEQRERGMRMLRWIKGVTLRNRERGIRMLRWIKGVTLRNTEREE